MSRYVFKMPDLGEGTVSAEVVEWKVKVGDMVTGRPGHRRGDDRQGRRRDSRARHAAASSSVTGQPGDMVAVGAELIAFDTSATRPQTPAAGPRGRGARCQRQHRRRSARPAAERRAACSRG